MWETEISKESSFSCLRGFYYRFWLTFNGWKAPCHCLPAALALLAPGRGARLFQGTLSPDTPVLSGAITRSHLDPGPSPSQRDPGLGNVPSCETERFSRPRAWPPLVFEKHSEASLIRPVLVYH